MGTHTSQCRVCNWNIKTKVDEFSLNIPEYSDNIDEKVDVDKDADEHRSRQEPDTLVHIHPAVLVFIDLDR